MSSSTIWDSKKAKEKEKKQYEKRKEKVAKTNNEMISLSIDYATSVNSVIDALLIDLSEAIVNLPIGELKNSIDSKKERGGITDKNLSAFSNNISREIIDCERKIRELEDDIRVLDKKYKAAVEEERKEREETLKKFFHI